MKGLNSTSLLILLLFTFASSIFYILLLIERRVWSLVFYPESAFAKESDVRFVHRSLKRLIPVLPPSNGVVVIGGLISLVWQGIKLGWTGPSIAVLAFWFLGQTYIIVFGKIASAIRDVWSTPTDGELEAVSRGVTNLIRQHRNGLIHAIGVLALELALISMF